MGFHFDSSLCYWSMASSDFFPPRNGAWVWQKLHSRCVLVRLKWISVAIKCEIKLGWVWNSWVTTLPSKLDQYCSTASGTCAADKPEPSFVFFFLGFKGSFYQNANGILSLSLKLKQKQKTKNFTWICEVLDNFVTFAWFMMSPYNLQIQVLLRFGKIEDLLWSPVWSIIHVCGLLCCFPVPCEIGSLSSSWHLEFLQCH